MLPLWLFILLNGRFLAATMFPHGTKKVSLSAIGQECDFTKNNCKRRPRSWRESRITGSIYRPATHDKVPKSDQQHRTREDPMETFRTMSRINSILPLLLKIFVRSNNA